jgi:tRNA (mo5U34)-methyltransferase
MSRPAAGSELPADIRDLAPWFHNLHLPNGAQTAPDHPLGDFPAFKWREISRYLPDNLSGWEALDIGCNAGFYTIELARRGARVTGIDIDPHFLRQARWAVREWGVEQRVTLEQMQVYELARWTQAFDLVLFMGVFYHLRYPNLALDLVSARVRKYLVFQTLTIPGEESVAIPEDLPLEERNRLRDPGWPRMAYIEKCVAGDPTNWWVPNHACVMSLLSGAGLRVVCRPGHEIYVCSPSDMTAAREPHQELRAIYCPAGGESR